MAVFLKIIIQRSEPDLKGHEAAVLRCLAAVRQHSPGVYETTMAEQLPKLTEGLTDAGLKRVVRLFAVEPRVWGWLGQDLHIRLKTVVTNYKYDEGASDHLFAGLVIDELKPLLLGALNRLDDSEQVALIARAPRAEFIDTAFGLFKEAGSWRYAERLAADLILPLSKFYAAEDIKRLLEIVEGNDQIYGASAMPDTITDLFKRTDRLHAEARPHWEWFLGEQHNTRYSFSPLAEAMKVVGMDTPSDEDDEEDD